MRNIKAIGAGLLAVLVCSGLLLFWVVTEPKPAVASSIQIVQTQAVFGTNTVTFSATPTFNATLGTWQVITLTGNVTGSTLSNLVTGQMVGFRICQDATGSRTFVAPANAKGFFTIGSTASKCSDQLGWSPDGTNWEALSTGVINQ